MQRVVFLSTAILISIASLVAAIAIPRYDCLDSTRLFEVPEEWPQDIEVGCAEVNQRGTIGTPGWQHASDRLWMKITILSVGLFIALSFVLIALKGRRPLHGPLQAEV